MDRFRFRNVLSAHDYFTAEQDNAGFVTVINLDTGYYSQINTDHVRYALLSSPDEIEYLNRLRYDEAITAAGQNYGLGKR